MSTTNNITLLSGTISSYDNKRLITQDSLENMLGRDYMDNTSVEVRAYIKIFIAQLELNK